MLRPRFHLLLMVLLSLSALAQNVEVKARPLTDSDIQLLRQDIQSIKDSAIKDTMEFTPEEAAAFWPIYREYAKEQQSISAKRLNLLTDYAQNLDRMSNATAKGLTEKSFDIERETLALRQKYYPQFEKALGGKRAAKFYQVDNRLTLMMNLQLAAEVPLIP